ncbi:cytochrome b [Kangiella geojedonensis]|uniref:Cytochrome B561 n=1 Tax=Kangiella geojedonensis TaxID=914150 RepID=A0A0F6TNS1_9GAMM|nr:cytochrome b [Kangiella geojedonensis]AKE51024.1 Cytochrome B561 [Kangiella geojedonensis]
MTIKDNSQRYGQVSRLLHWAMALLILWQFMSAGAHFLFDETAVEAFFWPTHKPVGFLILILAVIRVIWALVNVVNRPKAVTLISKLGHISLYLLLLAIPIVALLRQYGSGRSFEPFGIPVFSGFEGEKIKWMTDLGSNFHSTLGWILLALIVGHIAMAVWHRKSKNQQDVLPRMWGKSHKG